MTTIFFFWTLVSHISFVSFPTSYYGSRGHHGGMEIERKYIIKYKANKLRCYIDIHIWYKNVLRTGGRSGKKSCKSIWQHNTHTQQQPRENSYDLWSLKALESIFCAHISEKFFIRFARTLWEVCYRRTPNCLLACWANENSSEPKVSFPVSSRYNL